MPPPQMIKDRKIRVLRIINRFNIGGPTYNATFLTRYLGDDYETLLVGGMPEEGEADSLHICKQYDVSPVILEELTRNPSLVSDWKAFLKLRKIIKDFKPDVVHTHAAKAGALGRAAAFTCGVPVRIHTFHGHVFHSYFGKVKTAIFKIIERFLAVISTRIVAISPQQKNELVDIHWIASERKVEMIPLGFDLDRFHSEAEHWRTKTRAEYSISEDEVAIAIIGRLTAIKNHSFLIEVMDEVQKKTNQKVALFIVGDGDLRTEIETLVNEKVWNDSVRIVFTSWIKEVNQFVPGMDIVALCSFNEGTPVSLIEAQAANVTVISNDVGGIKDIISDGKTGVIVTKLDKFEYTNKLLALIDDKTIRELYRNNGWDFVRERYHYTRLAADMDKLYKRLLKHEK